MSSSSNQKGEAAERRRKVRRRRRSVEEKREIAEASLQPGTSVAEVALAFGVHPSQVGKWRRSYRKGLLGNLSAPSLLAVRIADAVELDGTSHASEQKSKQSGSIHIELARARVSIDGSADATTVRAVLESLAG